MYAKITAVAICLSTAASAFAAEPASAASSAQRSPASLDGSHCDAYRNSVTSVRTPKDLGLVRLRVEVSPQGEVLDSEVVEHTSTNFFAHVVQQNFSRCRFNPARENGVPVQGRVLLTLDFVDHPRMANDAACPPVASRERPPSDGPMPATRLRIRFARTGEVTSVDVLQPSGIPALDDAAVKAYRQCHFDPAAAGQPAFQEEWVTTLKWGG